MVGLKGFLSQVGKIILINVVLNTILIYTLMISKVFDMIHNKIERIFIEFFWNNEGNNNKINFINWNIVSKSKSEKGS